MEIESGQIVIWSGTEETIPAGYYLCDGDNGTPDLADLFPRCSDCDEAPDSVAGDYDHNHDFESYAHSHPIESGSGFDSGTAIAVETTEETASGVTDNVSCVPPFFALYYIMKA